MCGIFTLLNETHHSSAFIQEQFQKGRGRGPEDSKFINNSICGKYILGFHRLAINGLNQESNQPIVIGNITLICNGEIYNYKDLYRIMGVNVIAQTNSDCEVIIHLYNKYGMEQTLQMLDGVFAFILLDVDINTDFSRLYVARDPYGVRPLYIMENTETDLIGFASELKMLSDFGIENEIQHFRPGTFSEYRLQYKALSTWHVHKANACYHHTSFCRVTEKNSLKYIYAGIQYHFMNAVKKRCLVTDRPIACLLSGGLDSSLVTALANEYHKQVSTEPLETYSIGMAGSEDLRYAKQVAEYLGTNHTEIILTEEEFLNAIPEVIYTIESYDTTTVRASIGNYLIGKFISENSDAKVILNGDGSDELCGGYLYMHKCPDAIEFDKECRRLLSDIHAFDVLRSDKCISSHGLEPRTPFLDRAWVQFYLSLDPTIRFHAGSGQCEKFLLRSAFSKTEFINSNGYPLLPDNILWRTKEAFSDGVGMQSRSLYQIIQERYPDEKAQYKKIFHSHFAGYENVVPYLWMPKYVNSTDASARTLDIYKQLLFSNSIV